MHFTMGGSAGLDEPASWQLMGGSEFLSTIYALAQVVDFDHGLVDASKVSTIDTARAT